METDRGIEREMHDPYGDLDFLPERHQLDLIRRIRHYYETDMFRPFRLYCQKEPVEMESTDHIPNFGDKVNIHRIGDLICWSCDVPIECSSHISSSTADRQVEYRHRYKIRHEFVAESLGKEGTDKRLSEVFTNYRDDDDILTPDFIFTDEDGVHHVIEVATSRTQNPRNLESVMQQKLFKYESALETRSSEGCITYTVIVVGLNKVVSNIELSSKLVTELLTRMSIAVALEDVGFEMGILLQTPEDESHLTQLASEIRMSIDRCEDYEPAHEHDKITISNEYINEILSQPSEDDAFKSFLQAKSLATQEMRGANGRIKTPKPYIDKVKEIKDCKKSTKPIIPFPLILPKKTVDDQLPRARRMMSREKENESLIKLWNTAISELSLIGASRKWFSENKAQLRKEAMEKNVKELSRMEKERKEKRRSYHRVNLKTAITSKVKKDLSKDGVFGKSQEGTAHKQSREADQKRPFHWDTPVDDIEKFINSKKLFEKCDDVPEYFNDINKLLNQSSNDSMNNKEVLQDLRDWQNTNLFQWLEFISDVSFELAISCKQNTSSSEFILKKLRYWNALLLIKTTNSKSHIFYSILVPKEGCTLLSDSGNVGRPLIETAFNYVTSFCSVRVDKIENLATSSATMFGLVSFFSWYSKIGNFNIKNFTESKESCSMLLLTLLIKLEDKAQTEEVVTNVRYMYMEIFKSNQSFLKPNPFKILRKFPTIIRSRLSLYLIKKIIQHFNQMTIITPIKIAVEKSDIRGEGEDVKPGDEWVGLLNCFTGATIPDASRSLSLFYLGYFKNKNEVAQGNVEFKLVEKILEEEMKLDIKNADPAFGRIFENQTPKGKQFKLNDIKFGCVLMEKRLISLYGKDYKMIIEREILHNLSRQITNEIATLKASSSLPHTNEKCKVSFKNNSELHRLKVMEAVAINLESMDLNPILNLDKFLKKIEQSSGGVIADLFKKNQHGGLREIYVLTIESRIIQLYIETIARTLCQYFEEETLTHPENKLKLLDRHKARAAKYAKVNDCSYADYCNSSDKTRWNQNFLMTALCVPLIRLTPSYFHVTIKRSLNLWANKLVKIPPEVCKLLLNKVQLSSDVYNCLLKLFWDFNKSHDSTHRNFLQVPHGSYLNLTTGMMQGILHYTSSLLHIAFLFSSKYFTLKYLRRRYPSWKFMMTQVCSSDDSASILSLFSDSIVTKLNKTDAMAIFDTEILMHTLTKYCQWFCMTESDKSTICLHDYVEFNSEFLFHNTIAKPFIKLIAACTNLTESESFMTRFHTLYNTISDLYTTGFPSSNVSVVQYGQAWLHYKTLGASTNGLFNEYTDKLIQYPSSVLGYFHLDSDKICGLMGYSFSEYLAYQSNLNLSKESKFYNLNELEASPSGGFSPSLIVKNGDNARWHNLLDVIESGTLNPKRPTITKDKKTNKKIFNWDLIEQRRERINKHFPLLFRHPTNKEELRLKLLMKASMPGVGKSLSKGNPFIESLSLSMYAINTHCFTKTSIIKSIIGGVEKRDKKTGKTSLLLEITNILSECERVSTTTEEIDQYLSIRFPMSDRYNEAADVITKFKDGRLIQVSRIRQRKTRIVIQPRVAPVPLTLQQVCGRLWFDFNLKVSGRVYIRCLDYYKFQFPWLADTYEETLKNSPFQTAVEMYNFISSLANKNRRLVLNGPGIYANTFTGQLRQLCRKHYKESCLLSELSIDRKKFKSSISLDELGAKLSLALTVPIWQTKSRLVGNLLETFSPTVDVASLKLMRKQDLILNLLSAFKKRLINKDQVLNILMESRVGMIVVYPRPQIPVTRSGKTKWIGEGEALVFYDGVFLRVQMSDDQAKCVFISDFQRIRQYPHYIQDVLEKLGLFPQNTSSVGRVVAKYWNHRYSPPTGIGMPIIVDPNLEAIHLDAREIKFIVRKQSCGIYSYVNNRRIPMIEFHPKTKDIRIISMAKGPDDVWGCWMNMQSLGVGRSIQLINSIVHGLEKSSFFKDKENAEIIKEWAKRTLQGRLKYRGETSSGVDYSSSIRDYSIVGDEDEEGVNDDFLDQFYEDFMNEDEFNPAFEAFESALVETMEDTLIHEKEGIVSPEDIGKIAESIYELDDLPIYSIFRNIREEEIEIGESVIRRDAFDYIYMHPFWDEFISTCTGRDDKFFSKIYQGIIINGEEDLSKSLMKILDIEEKGKLVSLIDKYAMETLSFNDLLGIGEGEVSEPSDD